MNCKKGAELRRLSQYLHSNPQIIHFGYTNLSERMMQTVISQLKSWERPDMYAVVENTTYIIEHFSFDASKETRKGMNGLQEENLLSKRLENTAPNDDWQVDKGEYRVDKRYLQQNFERHFSRHYQSIPAYQNELIRWGHSPKTNDVIVGFFIENLYPPCFFQRNSHGCGKIDELIYFRTLQFSEFWSNHPDVQFILFGCIYNGEKQLFYLEPHHPVPLEQQIDLDCKEVHLLHINKNEAIFFVKSMGE